MIRTERFKGLEEKIGYTFTNKRTLALAMTHSSYANEQRGRRKANNERLEFLGDAVLELISSDYLFAKYPGINELAQAEPEEIEEIVRPCGLGKSKARDISKCMRMLRDEFDSKVPDNFDDLMKLPGVGRKSANLIMGDVFGKPAIVTDTHCIRLCNRIGLVDNEKNPKKVEMALWKIIPPEEGSDFCHRLVYHGREVCTARTTPYCEKCCLADVCKSYASYMKEKNQ